MIRLSLPAVALLASTGCFQTGSWMTFDAGSSHVCGITINGHLSCWGSNDDGELGIGVVMNTSAEYAVPHPERVERGVPFREVAAGDLGTCAIDDGLHLWCWGRFNDPQAERVDPNPRQLGDKTWRSITGGSVHFCGIQTDDSLWCWGQPYRGALGVGRAAASQETTWPFEPVGGAWDSVTAGGGHTCGIRTDGSLWCWGDDILGQVGVGAATCMEDADQPPDCESPDTSVPLEVAAGTTWRAVDAGAGTTCGIQDDGSLWCWGANYDGSLGLGGSTTGETCNHYDCATTPLRVGADTSWTALSVSQEACAVRDDGGLWCWGRTWDGRRQLEPTQVEPDRTWIRPALGSEFTCALDTHSALWCWGNNGMGILADGTLYDNGGDPKRISAH